MIWKKDEQPDPVATQGVRDVAEQSGGEVTIVGERAKLEGTVISAGSLRVDGKVTGEIRADGDVMLTETSTVEADIRAKNVLVSGSFVGDIVVQGKAEVTKSGRVQGNIASASLVIQEGGVFIGQSKMGSGEGERETPAAAASKAATGTATDAAASTATTATTADVASDAADTPPAEKAKAGS